jgi:NADH dehydrogenase FAD-containing subunit
VDDAVVIRNRVVDSFERALHAKTDEERALETTFVIAGGGPAGVELGSEIRHLSRGLLPEYFQGAPPARVVLADAGDRILRAWDAELAEAGREKLCSCGVDVRLNTRIVAASETSVTLGGGMALVDILGIRLSGWLAWWIYRTAYLLKLVGMKNKVRVLLTFALNRVFDPDIASRMESAAAAPEA